MEDQDGTLSLINASTITGDSVSNMNINTQLGNDLLTNSFITNTQSTGNMQGISTQYLTSSGHNIPIYNWGTDAYSTLTNEERIDSILSSISLLTGQVDKLREAASELVAEIKVGKHERRTLTKTKE
jgi:hypothetical protein